MLNSRVEDINFYSKRTIRLGEKLFTLERPQIMGIVNITDDSFYKNSRVSGTEQILKVVEKQLHEGVDVVDLGAFSTRPHLKNISETEELKRLIPAVEIVNKYFPELPISVDTFRGKVAEEALNYGALIINDIGGFDFDPMMFEILKKKKPAYILMHRKGTLDTMHDPTHYASLFKELSLYFSKKIKILHEVGLNDIILDPGFGFSKKGEQNFDLLKCLPEFQFLNHPLLVGISRKSMIYQKLETDAEHALNGTTILNTFSVLKNASFLRVHDIAEAKQILTLLQK